MDGSQFRDAAHSAVEQIIEYNNSIEDRRVLSNVEPGYLKKLLTASTVQEDGEKWEDIQKDIERVVMPGLTHWQSPSFLAFYPANATYPGMLGELYSAAFTAAAFNWQCSPVITELETIVLDQMANLMSLPQVFQSSGTGGGVIQGSASEAIVTCMVAARDLFLRNHKAQWVIEGLSEDEIEDRSWKLRSQMVALGSDQAHSSTKKSAMICGTRFETVSTVDFRMTKDTVAAKLADLEKRGLKAFYLTVTIGTTNTAAVDDLEINLPDVWTHIDAAYAGTHLILPEIAHLTKTFANFTSFNTNMHKALLTPFDCSLLYVQTRKHLTDALSLNPSYLRNEHSDSGLVTDYRDWQIPLGRRFRALKVWFVLRTFGAKGLRTHIQNIHTCGKRFTELLRGSDLFEIVAEPAFGLNVFVLKNGKTKEVYEKVNSEGKIFLTSTELNGQYAIRVVGGSPNIEMRHLEAAFAIIKAAAEELA